MTKKEKWSLNNVKHPQGDGLQTIPGKSWFIALRIYGPEQAWFDKTWRPSEIELVE